MSWDYYEDFYGSEKETEPKPIPVKRDFSGLWLLGLGLLGGYLLFSKDDDENKKESGPKLDNLDKAVANKTDIHFNPSFSFPEIKNNPVIKEDIVMPNPIKDPEGGLTAEGRKFYKETEGANLQAGVQKVETLEDLKRWGQWARRFFGRSVLPPLKDENGEPTRLALDAQAWGCKIPKTKKEAKVIAKRGSEALKYYKELKKQGLKNNDSVRFKICHD